MMFVLITHLMNQKFITIRKNKMASSKKCSMCIHSTFLSDAKKGKDDLYCKDKSKVVTAGYTCPDFKHYLRN